ncbi:uncharacterized protein LOC135345394 [Halichondria panicea]|uniref:uncharacterized protein LOC135345394 n=1 Tax=Halichondria panicea TaxID=6063 RepID=UPI00312B5D98
MAAVNVIKLTLVLLAGVCLVQQLANGARDQESFKCLAEKISSFSEAAFKVRNQTCCYEDETLISNFTETIEECRNVTLETNETSFINGTKLDGLSCLAERIPSNNKTFQDCRTLGIRDQTQFCNNATCLTYFSSAYEYCDLCNPFKLACTETNRNCYNWRYDNLTCLFKEAARDGLKECQRKRLEEGIGAYCLDKSCYFVEEAYNKCGFAWYGCNPVRETCNKHFKSSSVLRQQCSSGGKPVTTITAVMILVICSVLMI